MLKIHLITHLLIHSLNRPNLFIVGAPKCGTTTLYYWLKSHPDIFMSPVKEPPFFDRDIRLEAGRFFTEERYLGLFAKAGTQRYRGESHVWNLYSREAAAKIRTFSPDAKIIVMLRNPLEVITSMYHYNVYGLLENQPTLAAALVAETERKAGRNIPATCYLHDRLFYRDTVRYAEQVRRYLAVFPPEQVHVIVYDDLKKDAPGVVRRLLEFLDLPAEGWQPDFATRNKGVTFRSRLLRFWSEYPPFWAAWPGKLLPTAGRKFVYKVVNRLNAKPFKAPPMPADVRENLKNELRDDVAALGQLLGRDLNFWMK